MPSVQEVREALRQVEDPDLHRDIVSLGFVQNVEIAGGRVSVRVVLTTPACPVRDQMKGQVEQVLLAMPGVKEVDVTMDAEVRSSQAGGDQRPVEGVRNIIASATARFTASVDLPTPPLLLAKRG